MSTRYADIVDVAEVREIVGDTYQNNAKVVASGLVSFQGDIMQGTTEEWIKETLFESDTAGQVVGVNSEISLKSKSQTQYKMPVVWRADGAELDDIEGEITVKVRRAAEATVANGISRKSAQMLDEVFISIIDGIGAYQKNNTENYKDNSSTQINVVDLQELKAERSDEGLFIGGILLAKGSMIHKMHALGMVAYTSNTLGSAKQDQVVASGVLGTVLGMELMMDDKISLDGSAHFVYLLEKGCIIGKNGGAALIDPIQRKERSFKDVIKFRIKAGGTVRGMTWGGSASDVISNNALATYTNWSRAASYAKYVPVCTGSFQAPTF